MGKRIIIAASSDIGDALARRWLKAGHEVFGTYRTRSSAVDALEKAGARLVPCNLGDPDSIGEAGAVLRGHCDGWGVMVSAAGGQEPVGPFAQGDFNAWRASLGGNFTGQMQMIHELLPARNTRSLQGPLALLFAGGGVNNATVNYSAYTIAKIALIKMCELLDAEIPDTRFTILGPGWVKTKIHQATLDAGARAGDSFPLTQEKLSGDECTPIDRVLDCCDWVVQAPREVVGGRNFSVVHDPWGEPGFEERLRADPNAFKLRRSGNG